MRVRFKDSCFIEGTIFKRPDGQLLSGQHYEKGVYDIPDGVKLPKTAEILKDGEGSEKPLPIPQRATTPTAANPLHDHDSSRAAGVSEDQAVKAAEPQRTGPVKRKPGRPRKYA